MSVKMNFSQALAEGSTTERLAEVKGGTVGECLNQLIKKLPELKPWLFDEKGNLHDYIDIFVNKESAFPEQLSRSVKDGDELHILVLIGGG